MEQRIFQNPILNGFFPDPSICRVDEDYYMVTSSFCYFPGIPIFHSRDLVHWEQLGHVLTRKEQLDFRNCGQSEGVWAPAIRHYNGLFYVINTFFVNGKGENYICTATNPAGPWSNAVIIEGADGIDPSLFFGEDGRMWYTGHFEKQPSLYEGHNGIYLNELNPETFQFIGERKVIWHGEQSHEVWLEAPHIYHIGDWYYLVAAEGGTYTNHCVKMARCKTIDGDYEICGRNPILSHRHLPLCREISVTGHADIIETQNGEWWMVLLAVRPYGNFHYNLGRETFLAPIVWDQDGWPRIDTADGLVHTWERAPQLPEVRYPTPSPNDHFESDRLSHKWNILRQPKTPFYSLTERPGFLRLYARPEQISEQCSPSFVARRQQHKYFIARTAMEFTHGSEQECAGLVLIQNERYLFEYVIAMRDSKPILSLFERRNGKCSVLQETEIQASSRYYLAVDGRCDTYTFTFSTKEGEEHIFYESADASVLSTVTARGFVGTYVGMYASSNGTGGKGFADFDWFEYYPTECK